MKRIKELYHKTRRKLHYFLLRLYYFIWPITYGLNKNRRAQQIVVSLTSHTKRLQTLHLCLRSLLNQTCKPDKVILYLGTDVDKNQITYQIQKLKKYGLEIVTDCRDIKPHKKYYYAMQEYPDAIIITVDDDGIYDKTLVESLFDSYMRFPDAVSCRRAHRLEFDSHNHLLPYKDWTFSCDEYDRPSMLFLATGVGGILYPPHCLGKETFDIEKICDLCLNADDIWLKCMQILQHMPVVIAKSKCKDPVQISGTEQCALSNVNLTQSKNDDYIERVTGAYHIDLESLRQSVVHEGVKIE